jgi:hypothetical protein
MNAEHQRLIGILREGRFESLWVRRHGKSCWFFVRHGGKDQIFVNEFGECPDYRHVWQIRKWLEEKFGIGPDKVTVVNAEE